MRALRILHVTPYYEEAWAYGGIPRLSATMGRGLARRGHQVTVCTTDACEQGVRLSRPNGTRRSLRPWPVIQAADGVELRVFPNVSNALAYHLQFFVPLGLGAYLRQHVQGFDVAHVHGCHHLPGTTAARHLRQAGVPYVLAPNGTAPRIERRRLAKYLFDATLGRGLIPGASRILAVSEAERIQLASLGLSPASIRVIPNPVDVAEFADPPPPGRFRRRFGVTAPRVVLYLGTLTPRKRVDVLIRAFASLRRSDATLVIAGNDLGAGRALRRLVHRLGLEAVATFTGLLKGRDRLEALIDADLVVYPAQDEIFGLVPLEALLCGTPVIVSDDSGCGEVIGRAGGGSVVRRGDAAALAEAITRMLGGARTWRQAALDARERVRRLYGWDTVREQLEALYDELARRHSV
ncbi:MAG: glycosyltransferase [Candidatus Rokuibacteriota bacterium]